MQSILSHLFDYKTFTCSEAYEILNRLTSGEFNPSQIAAFMTAFSMRSIRVEELEGFRDAMYDLSLKVHFDGYPLIDLCGTGGDGKNTFNISTLASFIVAGAGYHVVKHGNYGVSSGCGSSNVMEYLGYRFTNDFDVLRKQLETAHICFLHAPLFHPAMKVVAPIRRELGVKTFFNMLGPLTNPANPDHQMVGVYSLELARLYAYLMEKSNKKYTIVHALDGYDEISLTGNFKTVDAEGEHVIELQDLGIKPVSAKDIAGGETVEQAATIFTNILEGQGTAVQNQVVISNAAVSIRTFHPEKCFADAYAEAETALLSGQALQSFKTLIAS